ncbi:MAG: DNA polymerase I, partial [Pirellulales bacterium]|nr:DNA polymerase I [Pirellulales bacterium]
DQVVDFQALVGDKIDNIPGIPLIGPKIAAELLNQYGTLEQILDHADQIKQGKRRQNLIDYRDQALLSRQLVALDRNVPLELDWNAAQVGGHDPVLLGQLAAEFGFRGLGERLVALGGSQARLPTWEADYQLIHSPEKLLWLARELAKQSIVSIDTETTDISPRWADLVGLSFAWRPGEAFYVPLRGPSSKEEAIGDSSCHESDLRQAPSKPRIQEPSNPFGMAPDEILDILRPVLENPAIAKIGQNLKYDIVVLRGAGIRVQGIAFDTMVADYLLDAGTRTHRLDDLSRRFLDHSPIQIEDLIGKGKAQKRMDAVPVDQVAEYAAEDADIPLRLFPILNRLLEQDGLEKLNASVEVPLIGVLAEMEFNGIRVDTDRLAVLSRRFGEKADMLAAQIEELAGHPLNIDSPKQLAQVLFRELGLPVIRKTKTGPSTNVLVLEELASTHPLPARIMEYRQFTKLKNTYVDTLPDLVHPETGRVHASFNQVVAATGRLSSSDPNLQNIPVRTEEGRAIRSAFTAGPPGWKLLAADYSQIELRILAHYCGDGTLQAAFEEDQDIHTLVASQVYHVPVKDVTKVQRQSAKAVNFGILYGQSAFGLSKSLGIPLDEATAFIDAYFSRYPGVDRFFAETLHACHEQAYVRTILGRRRSITGVRPAELLKVRDGRFSARQFNFAERTALNTVIQGSAADLIKLAMLSVHRQLTDEKLAANMLLQIHDELVFEAPQEELHRLACLVRTSMTSVLSLKVPLKVDIKTGSNWADCEAYY